MSEAVRHRGPLWRWTGSNGVAWHFVTIDGDAGEQLSAAEAMRRLELGRPRGFRSLKVTASVGTSEWSTSCFPDKARGWLLPIKAQIRKAEGLAEGDDVTLVLRPQ